MHINVVAPQKGFPNEDLIGSGKSVPEVCMSCVLKHIRGSVTGMCDK